MKNKVYFFDRYFFSNEGHYRLHSLFFNDLFKKNNTSLNSNKIFFSGDSTLIFTNMVFLNKISVKYFLISLLNPQIKKVFIVHAAPRNKIFLRLISLIIYNYKIIVYSNSLKNYLKDSWFSNIYVKLFPNARILKNNSIEYAKEYKKYDIIVWGGASRNFNWINFIKLTSFKNLKILFCCEKPKLNFKYSSRWKFISQPNNDKLANLICQSKCSIMFFKNEYEYYEYNKNASGVFITNNLFGVPTFIFGKLKFYQKEIESDNVSKVCLNYLAFEDYVLKYISREKPKIPTRLKYSNINKEFFL